MPKFAPSEVHQQALDQSARMSDGRLLWWENKQSFHAWLYRMGVLTGAEYVAAGGDLKTVPTAEDLLTWAEELDANLDKRKCVYCHKVLPPTGEAEISYCLNCGASG